MIALPGFLRACLELVASADAEVEIRIMAAIMIKQYMTEGWHDESRLSSADKLEARAAILKVSAMTARFA